MANRQIFQLNSRTLALSDVIATQDATGVSEAGKNTLQDVKNLIGGVTDPLVYAARITQSGTANPTAVEASNTTGATVSYLRTAPGFFSATFNSAVITSNKNNLQLTGRGAGGYSDPKYFGQQVSSTTVINWGCFRYSDDSSDDNFVIDILLTIYL